MDIMDKAGYSMADHRLDSPAVQGRGTAMGLFKPAFKISFCTTCKNRLWQLNQTMPQNLAAIEADGCAELVLLNYNSEDELDVWIRQFRSAIEAGTLLYIHERSAPYFHAPKAKNLAHFAATGEFVVNLDGDNFIGGMIATYRRFWTDNADAVIHTFSGIWRDGTFGRIGLAKRHFLALGGYDEEMFAVFEDRDLLLRAEALGLDYIRLEQKGVPPIPNDVAHNRLYSGMEATPDNLLELNRARSAENIRIGRLVANSERKRRAVLVNFSTGSEI
jgi:hypothetical protein